MRPPFLDRERSFGIPLRKVFRPVVSPTGRAVLQRSGSRVPNRESFSVEFFQGLLVFEAPGSGFPGRQDGLSRIREVLPKVSPFSWTSYRRVRSKDPRTHSNRPPKSPPKTFTRGVCEGPFGVLGTVPLPSHLRCESSQLSTLGPTLQSST